MTGKTKTINDLEAFIKTVYSLESIEEIRSKIEGNKDILGGQEYFVDKILGSRSVERARYYLERLLDSLSAVKTNGINDINLNRWNDYDDIITDSLWNFEKRDRSGTHLGWYWGNFVPQIPRQLILRYTKKGDWILDPFMGSGTTLIECKIQGRNGLGVDLNGDVVSKASERISLQKGIEPASVKALVADSTISDFSSMVEDSSFNGFQLAILHPPYHDIIKFSGDSRDLSNKNSVEDFLESMRAVIRNSKKALKTNGIMAIVIGDKFNDSKLEPLGFMTMNAAMEEGLMLKSIVVKNFDSTRGKRNQEKLWRYRAFSGGFYVFKHEYILILQNTARNGRRRA